MNLKNTKVYVSETELVIVELTYFDVRMINSDVI